MYAFSEDERHLLFMDGFGLTRLSLPSQAKTDVKISGSESAGNVTMSRDGSVAVTHEDLWDKSVVWSLPELRPSKRFERFENRGAIVHPAGTHFIVYEVGALKLEPLRKTVLLPLRLDAPPESKPPSAGPITLALEGGQQLSALTLGGPGRPNVMAPLRIAHDGTLLCFTGTELVCATLTGVTIRVHWRRAVTTPEGARLELYADAQRCVLMVHHGRRWTIFERNGTRERSSEIESLGVPAVAGAWLAYQPAQDVVVRRNLETGEQTEHSLAFGKASEGVGTVFVGAKGSLLCLTADRERVLDLIAKLEIPRGLPRKQLDVRQRLLGLARPYVDAARLAGACIELGRVEFDTKHNSVSISHRIAGGDNLFGALLAAHSSSVWRNCQLPGGWRMGSYGGAGAISYDPGVTLEQLVAGYTALADVGIGFGSTIDFWARQFDSWGHPPKATACLGLLAQALVGVVRGGPDAKLDFAALADRGVPSVDEVIAAFANYPTTATQLDFRTTRFTCGLFNRLYGADAARIWTAVFLEDEHWAQYGSNYTDFGSYGLEPLLDAHPEVVAQLEAWFHDRPPVEDGRQYYFDQLRQRLQR